MLVKKKRTCPDAKELEVLAREVGPIMLDGWNRQQARKFKRDNGTEGVERKEKDNTPVTETDRAVNKRVIEYMGNSDKYRHVSILGEEEGKRLRLSDESDVFLITDPLDGTLDFIAGIPVWTFSCAAVRSGRVEAAVIYDPLLNRMWCANRGQGCFLNGQRVHVADNPLNLSFISVMWWSEGLFPLDSVRNEIDKAGGHWTNNCAAAMTLALVADSGLDGSVFAGRDPWETAAGLLLVEEGGGVGTDFNGNRPRFGWKEDKLAQHAEINGHVVASRTAFDPLFAIVARAVEAHQEIQP